MATEKNAVTATTLTLPTVLRAARKCAHATAALRGSRHLDDDDVAEAASALLHAGASVADVHDALDMYMWGGSLLVSASSSDDDGFSSADLMAYDADEATSSALRDVARDIVDHWDVDGDLVEETGGVEISYSISATVVHPDGEIDDLYGEASRTVLPPEPPCTHDVGHDWRTTHPRWPTGEPVTERRAVCARCGLHRSSWTAADEYKIGPFEPTQTVRYYSEEK